MKSAVFGLLLAVLVANGQSFRSVALEETAETSANASLGDLDGDGDLDIVLAKGRHWPLVDFILLNDGAGGFEQRHEVGAVIQSYMRFVIKCRSNMIVIDIIVLSIDRKSADPEILHK